MTILCMWKSFCNLYIQGKIQLADMSFLKYTFFSMLYAYWDFGHHNLYYTMSWNQRMFTSESRWIKAFNLEYPLYTLKSRDFCMSSHSLIAYWELLMAQKLINLFEAYMNGAYPLNLFSSLCVEDKFLGWKH